MFKFGCPEFWRVMFASKMKHKSVSIDVRIIYTNRRNNEVIKQLAIKTSTMLQLGVNESNILPIQSALADFQVEQIIKLL